MAQPYFVTDLLPSQAEAAKGWTIAGAYDWRSRTPFWGAIVEAGLEDAALDSLKPYFANGGGTDPREA